MLARSSARPARTRFATSVVIALVASLTLAACGGDEKKTEKPEERPESQPTQGGATLAAVWPLTGLPATGATPKRPVMVVKIDNTSSSEPQVGLAKADIVVEELVEGGITRLAAMFYTNLPKIAGPVRSMRASDIGIVKPTHAVLIGSGAAPPTYGRLNKAKVTYYAGGPGYYREGSRPSLYSLMVRMPELARTLKSKSIVPANYLPWGDKDEFRGKGRANRIDVTFSRATTTSFAYDRRSKTYTNTNSHAARNGQFKPKSLLVLRVREGDAGYLDPAGNRVPEMLFFGKGKLVLFHGGKYIRGQWSKAKRESPLRLTAGGKALEVPAGKVWIELLPNPNQGGSINFRR